MERMASSTCAAFSVRSWEIKQQDDQGVSIPGFDFGNQTVEFETGNAQREIQRVRILEAPLSERETRFPAPWERDALG